MKFCTFWALFFVNHDKQHKAQGSEQWAESEAGFLAGGMQCTHRVLGNGLELGRIHYHTLHISGCGRDC